MKYSKTLLASLLGIGIVLSTSSAHALTFTASQTIGGYVYAASADFTYDSSNHMLSILLKNNATNPAANQGQTLSGIYFDVVGNPVLLKSSASVGPGSTIVNDTPNLNDSKIGQEYAFRNNIGTAEASFTDARYGISSTGLGIFSPGNRFDTSGNLAGPSSGSVGGDDFSIVPTSQASFSSGGLTGTPFVRNSMLFKLQAPVSFSLTANDIKNIAFHYGSGQEFATIVPPSGNRPGDVPEPGVVALLVGVAPLTVSCLIRKRKLNKNR